MEGLHICMSHPDCVALARLHCSKHKAPVGPLAPTMLWRSMHTITFKHAFRHGNRMLGPTWGWENSAAADEQEAHSNHHPKCARRCVTGSRNFQEKKADANSIGENHHGFAYRMAQSQHRITQNHHSRWQCCCPRSKGHERSRFALAGDDCEGIEYWDLRQRGSKTHAKTEMVTTAR